MRTDPIELKSIPTKTKVSTVTLFLVVSHRESDEKDPNIGSFFVGTHAYQVNADNAKRVLAVVPMLDDFCVDTFTGCLDLFLSSKQNYQLPQPYSTRDVGYIKLAKIGGTTTSSFCDSDEHCVIHDLTYPVQTSSTDLEYGYLQAKTDMETLAMDQKDDEYFIESPTLNLLLDTVEVFIQHGWIFSQNCEFSCGSEPSPALWSIRMRHP